jgi:hypothetical protein
LVAVAVVEVTVRVAVAVPPEDRSTVTPLPVKLEFVNVIDGLLETIGLTVRERVTFPVNVLILVRVRVVEFDEPRGFTNDVELATIVKAGTVTVMLRSVAWIRFGDPPLAFNIRS